MMNGAVVSMQGGDPQLLIEGHGHQERASLSPNGRWIAYASDENGRFETFIRPFPDVDGGKWQISRSGGDEPQWGPEGRELFFLGPDAMMVIDIDSELTISSGIPRRLFPTAAYAVTDLEWSVSSDGQRFLMQKPAPVTASAGVAEQFSPVIVFNWFEELKRLVPTAE